MHRKTICIFAPYDFTKRYGNTLRPLLECQGLFENGFTDFYLLCARKNSELPFDQEEFEKGIFKFIPERLRIRSIAYLYNIPWFRKVRIRQGVRLVHAHNFYSYFAIPRKGTKVLMDLHTCKGNEIANTYKNQNLDSSVKRFIFRRIISTMVRRLERKIVRKENRIIVASPNIAEVFVRDFKVASKKFLCINNMLDPIQFDRNEARHAFTIGVVGGFKDNINREQLDVISAVANEVDAPFKLIGSIYREDVNRMEKIPNVEVLGKVSDDEYSSWMSKMSVLFAPYPTFRDGGGLRNKIMEALVCGTPVLTSRGGAEGLVDLQGVTIAEEAEDYIRILNSKSFGDKPDSKKRNMEFSYLGITKNLISLYKKNLL